MHCSPMLLVMLLTASIFVSQRAAYAADSPRPNVVVILTDDQGTLDVNCFGATDLHTPNLDRLAREGVRFTQAYAHMVCCPARAALMTGRHPQRGDVNDWTQGNLRARGGLNMALSEVTLAEALKSAGYRTALFGKWHLGAAADSGPTRQGFDRFFGHRGGFIDNYKHFFLHQNGFHDLYEGTTEIFAEGEYFPEMNVARALKFLEQNRDAPFFLFLPMNTPHYPEQPPARHLERYADTPQPRRTYAAFVTTTDELIGRVLDKLDALELTDDTIVIFMSDNGHSTEQNAIDRDDHSSGLPKGHNYGANGGGGYTGPWIGHKATFFEGGVRVPAMIRYPARLPRNEVRDQAVTIMDWHPTVLELCGVAPATELDGRSLLEVIASDKAPSPHPVLHFQWINSWAVRRGDWKLIHVQGRGEKSVGRDHLYNLAEEKPETIDHADAEPRLVEHLRKLHDRWADDVFARP